MREKGLDMGDRELRADIGCRSLWTLNRTLLRGAAHKDEYAADARWTPPISRE
jgi:hypothetical protein